MNCRVKTLLLPGAIAIACTAAPSAVAQGLDPGEVTPAAAQEELREVVEASKSEPPATTEPPRTTEVTADLRDLALVLPKLRGSDRRKAKAILARPPDGPNSEPFGGGWPTNVPVDHRTAVSPNFIVHWPELESCDAPSQGCDEPDLGDEAPANGIPDYIDQVAAAMEQSRAVQNGTLEWPDYKDDGSSGGDGKLDVYVADICNENWGPCVFGYASPDDSTPACGPPQYRCSAFLVLDNDYNFDEFGYPDPGIPLRVTTAHEYNHILQFNIDTAQDRWMFESTATWSEEKTFPDDDDWLFYVDSWAQNPQQPLTSGAGLKQYGSAVWNHWIERGYSDLGPGVVLDAWQASHETDPEHFAVAAYDKGLTDLGSKGFSREFLDLAVASSEWRTGLGGLPNAAALEDMSRSGRLRMGARPKGFTLDHTAFRLMRVKTEGADLVRLRARIQDRVRSGIALVARDGTKKGGDVVVKSRFKRRGGKARVRLNGAQAYERITAVAVNADGRLRANGSTYRKDSQAFELRLR